MTYAFWLFPLQSQPSVKVILHGAAEMRVLNPLRHQLSAVAVLPGWQGSARASHGPLLKRWLIAVGHVLQLNTQISEDTCTTRTLQSTRSDLLKLKLATCACRVLPAEHIWLTAAIVLT